MNASKVTSRRPLRVGAVNYLNSKPLVEGLDRQKGKIRLSFDLPGRLADDLAAGRLDVGLVPSIEFFRQSGCTVISDACVACYGAVQSVKLFFRKSPAEVRRLALDEGSRTSAALARVLLAEQQAEPLAVEPLPIGASLDDSDADAVLMIGDRAMRASDSFSGEVWDLGQRWWEWKRLPFVFAMWVARPGVDASRIAGLLAEARDRGVARVEAIARREAAALDIDPQYATQYLRDHLHFTLGERELAGLSEFYRLCVPFGLAPVDGGLSASRIVSAECPVT